MHLKHLVNFSETRFANSSRQVYIDLHYDLQPVVVCLEDKVKISDENPSNGKLTRESERSEATASKIGKRSLSFATGWMWHNSEQYTDSQFIATWAVFLVYKGS